jgi:hypothetical protein
LKKNLTEQLQAGQKRTSHNQEYVLEMTGLFYYISIYKLSIIFKLTVSI